MANLLQPFVTTDVSNANLGPGAYSDNMWHQLESLHDVAVQTALLEKFRTASVYSALVPTQVALRTNTGAIAESMTVKGIYAMEPNYGEVGRRQIWFNSNYTDTFQKSIVFRDYADKVALHEYDEQVQSYLFRGQIGLVNIARGLLGESVTIALDLLARNAFLDSAFWYVKHGATLTAGRADPTSGLPNFSGILSQGSGTPDLFDPNFSRQVWRQMTYHDIPMAADPTMPMGNQGTLLCVTTPDSVSALKASAPAGEWYDVNKYARPEMLLNYEVGNWDNTRFMQTRRNVLWNCGDINTQTTIAEVGGAGGFYGPGEGASALLVDKVYKIGQDATATGVRNWVGVATTLGFAVGDIVTIHRTQTDDFGVTGGVDYREADARVRRIVEIGTEGPTGASLSFDKPLFREFYHGDFITKAEHIHASVYVGGPAVVNGVGDPIMMYPKEPIDDANAIWRFIWRGRFHYQLFNPEFSYVVFHGGYPLDFGIGAGM